ncbi:hypothetical protein ACFW31_00810 [Nocardiopsis alba]|uniref:hypothetical protein n=1 Tax=Nocardiopsis alba TaxID=53437 RepID=UPI00366FCA80
MNDGVESPGMMVLYGCMVVVGVPSAIVIWVVEGRFSWMSCLGVSVGVWKLVEAYRARRAAASEKGPTS